MINWKKTAELNEMSVNDCKIYFDKYPQSQRKVVRIYDGIDCEREHIVPKQRSDKLCMSCVQIQYHIDRA